MKFFEKILSLIYWTRIFLSPFLAGIFLGAILWFSYPKMISLLIWIVLTVIGLFVGIVWASKVNRRENIEEALTRIYETPDLDEMKNKERK